VKNLLMADPIRYPRMTTEEVRETFLLDALCIPGQLTATYVDLDRTIIGMATPLAQSLPLPSYPQLRASYFLERRELGALNIGGPGVIHVGKESFSLENLDMLYIGRGNAEVSFTSRDASNPAVFYLLSYPSHAEWPTKLIRKSDAFTAELGSLETCNRRTICRYIHLEGARSSQLVMGVTHLHPGSSWNTLPPHTHNRRSEVYMYFNLPECARVLHLMGPAEETRHIVVADRQVVVSPGWSMHAGVGTQAYSFCWGMGGENQDYADMDGIAISDVK